MTGATNTGNEAPRDGLSAPESLQDPEVGTERRPGGLNGPQTGAQSLGSEPETPEVPQTGVEGSCGCGEPSTPGTVHRTDGPCYVDEFSYEERERTGRNAGLCIHPDGYDGECPCPTGCGCCKVAPAAEPLRARIAEAIEDAIYEHRELMCQWGETDGTTQEIARRATNAVMAVVDPSPPPFNLPRETVATLHGMLGRLLAANPAASSDTDDPLREQYAEAEHRLRLAHEARRAKEHQLDGIRRALCDVGAMRDNDPYSHADLEDVIRQAFTPPAPAATDACTDGCRDVSGIRGLLEHVGIDTTGRDITVAGKAVDAPDGGPTVAEAAADDEAHWTTKYAGEQP